MNSIVLLLASSLGKRNEQPNIAHAEDIVRNNNPGAIDELMGLLKGKALRQDAIKVLYEIGERRPELITEYLGDCGNAW